MEPKVKNSARWFYAAVALFAAWVAALGIMAFTTAEKPRAAEAAPVARQG